MQASFGRLAYRRRLVFVIAVALFAAAGADTDSLQPPPPGEPTAHADQSAPIAEPDEAKRQGELDFKTLDKQLFKRLFVKRRKEHLEAVKNLQQIDSYERQYKMINMLAEKMFDIIESKKALLENFTESDMKNISLLSESNTKTDITDAISNVLENIALFGDVALNLPDITQRVLRKQPKWNSTIRWSFEFLNRARDLLDKATLEMVELVLQELNITQRQPSYQNPNRIPRGPTNQPATSTKNAKKQPNKKDRRKRGPTLTKVEL